MPSIALPYRIYFLYVDPLMALSGAYLLYIDPAFFVNKCTPPIFFDKPIDPLSSALLMQIISLYIMHAMITSTVLRASTEVNVWKCVLGAISIADIGHLIALYTAAPVEFMDVANWRFDDWVNYGVLTFGLLMRISFILDIRNGKKG